VDTQAALVFGYIGFFCAHIELFCARPCLTTVTPESPTLAPLSSVNPGSDLVSIDTVVAVVEPVGLGRRVQGSLCGAFSFDMTY